MNHSIFCNHHTIKFCEIDSHGRIFPWSLGIHVQEIAEAHASQFGVGYYDLKDKGIAWMISRIRFKIFDVPKVKDSITIETWVSHTDRILSYRDTVFKDNFNNIFASVRTGWVIVDTVKREIGNTQDFASIFPHLPELKVNIADPERIKPFKIEENDSRISLKVPYSAVDVFGHTNNTKYIEWFYDCLDPLFLENHLLTDLVINYHHETKLNEQLELQIREEIGRTEAGFRCNIININTQSCATTMFARFQKR